MKRTPLESSREHDWDLLAFASGRMDIYRCQRCGEVTSVQPGEPPPDWKNCPGMKRGGSLERSKGLSPVSDRKDEKRPDLGTPLQDYVEGLPCLLSDRPDHRCEGEVVAHHVVHKNHAGDWIERGGERRGNLVPLCSLAGHQGGPESVHVLGRDTFEERWEVDLSDAAQRTGEAFREQGA